MKYVLLAVFISSASATCTIEWPNGTDIALKWWQCNSGPVDVLNTSTFDTNGNFEYPIHLGKPLVVWAYIDNPTNTYTDPNLRDTVKIWMWNRISCTWTSIPTFGLLTNQNACEVAVPCPVYPGKQWLSGIIDFSPYQAIINALQDDMPYQLELMLNDKKSGDEMCVMVQARAYIH